MFFHLIFLSLPPLQFLSDFFRERTGNYSQPMCQEGHFWKQRRALEKNWRVPEDVYIEVQRREEERKSQGLPPRLGVLPHSAVAEFVGARWADSGIARQENHGA
jgi:hypothetical protein